MLHTSLFTPHTDRRLPVFSFVVKTICMLLKAKPTPVAHRGSNGTSEIVMVGAYSHMYLYPTGEDHERVTQSRRESERAAEHGSHSSTLLCHGRTGGHDESSSRRGSGPHACLGGGAHRATHRRAGNKQNRLVRCCFAILRSSSVVRGCTGCWIFVVARMIPASVILLNLES